MDKLSSSAVVKIGIVTSDIVDVVERYKRIFSLKSEPVINVPQPDAGPAPANAYKRYKGKAFNGQLKSALIELEPVYLEVLEPVGDAPSPWRDHLEKYGTSVCFVTFYVQGFRHEIDLLDKEGYAVVFEEEKGHERYAYFDTLDKLGLTIELKERDE